MASNIGLGGPPTLSKDKNGSGATPNKRAGWSYDSKSKKYSQGAYTYAPDTGVQYNGGDISGAAAEAGYRRGSEFTGVGGANFLDPNKFYRQGSWSAGDNGDPVYSFDEFRPGQTNVPGAPDATQQLEAQQIAQAEDFRNSLGSMKKQMAEGLAKESMRGLSGNLRQVDRVNSSRGLGYGGINQGMRAQARNQAAGSLNSAVAESNAGLEDMANQMDARAVQTGVGIQQNQQAIQNQLYSQALARMNADNAATGGLLSTIANVGMMAMFL